MPVYPCPECGAQLRPANPVPAGKKLRCPKCQTVFAPAREPAKSAPPAVKSVSAADDDDESGGQYALAKEKSDAAADAQRDAAFIPIKDRFARSARGPALVQVVKPSTWLLADGVLLCIFAIAGSLWSIWPMVFKLEKVADPKAKSAPQVQQQGKRQFEELTDEQWKMRWVYLGVFVFQFAWGGIVCMGASKMHMLESYGMSMVGSIMALVSPGITLGIYLLVDAINSGDGYWAFVGLLLITVPGMPLCMWCAAILRRPDVIAGFAEEKPED